MKHKRMHHSDGMYHSDSMSHGRAHGQYENEVEKPALPHENHLSDIGIHGHGLHEFKRECDPIAYGQAASEGGMKDMKRLSAQAKDYHWD